MAGANRRQRLAMPLIGQDGKGTPALRRFVQETAQALADGSTVNGIEIGYRDIPRVTGGIERGKAYATSTGLTLNTGLPVGAAYSIYNDSGASITITQGAGLTLRVAGTATTGNYTLPQRGFITVWVNSGTEYVIL